ncbi:MAG TPA: TVP38/TMEM64 family protein [Clostridiales bacterium]|nr:TVP38/TMEM64 family protein [Clostridiales bacterium]
MKAYKISISFNQAVILLLTVALIIFSVYMYRAGVFTDTEAFIRYVEGFGIWAVVVFILIQAITVVIAILPTTVGCVAGVVIFGPWFGFLYNYLGVCLGCVVSFLLSRRYGSVLVKKFVGKRYFEKYIGCCQDQKRFNKVFTLTVLIPGAPHDVLCYLAGLTKMKLSKFITVILLCKPVTLILYSVGITAVLHYATALF